MTVCFQSRQFRLPRQEIGYLRFLVEGYDGLLFMRTLDGRSGLVEIAWPAEREAEARPLLDALGLEVGLHEVPGGTAEA